MVVRLGKRASAEKSAMNISEALVATLEFIGVDAVFAGSGQANANMLFALHGSKKIHTVVSRNEQAACFGACGYAMFSDKLGVCMGVGGPGAFNFLSGLGLALSDSLPVLAVSAYVPNHFLGKGDLGETSGRFRTPDSRRMFAATTKGSFTIENPEHTCSVLEQAIHLAFEGRPGPVHIDVPYDLLRAEVPNYRDIQLDVKPVTPTPKKVQQFAGMLGNALREKKKIVLLLGHGVSRSHGEAAARALVEQFQFPFMTTMDAKGVLPEDHPLSLGMTGVSGDPSAHAALHDADVVLAIGNSFAKWSTFKFNDHLYAHKTLMHINIDPKEINRVYEADYGMAADAKLALEALLTEMETMNLPVTPAQITVEKHCRQHIDYQEEGRMHPGAMVQRLSRQLPEQAILLGDAGSHMLWLAAYTQLKGGQNYQNPGSFGPMASHVNAALGVQLANPYRRVICGCGDGDFQMSGFEMLTAKQHKIPVIWIIFHNGEFNSIKLMHQMVYEGEEAFNTWPTPDFAAVAKACGVRSFSVRKIEDFDVALGEALSLSEPIVIDAYVDTMPPPYAMWSEAGVREY
jgi:acetolactate synthase I/II/III large subunit